MFHNTRANWIQTRMGKVFTLKIYMNENIFSMHEILKANIDDKI